RCRSASCAAHHRAARRFAHVPHPFRDHFGKPRAGRTADRGVESACSLRRTGPQGEETFMNWSDFYLICFLVGFGLSALAFVAGATHIHLPHLHLYHGVHMPHVHAGGAARGGELPWFNFGTIAAFLAWFGGTGYLLQHYYGVWYVIAL